MPADPPPTCRPPSQLRPRLAAQVGSAGGTDLKSASAPKGPRRRAQACLLLSGAAALLCMPAHSFAQDGGAGGAARNAGIEDGILPSLNALLPANSPLRLRFPGPTVAVGETAEYTRRFPIGGQEAVDLGITLPEPVGISVTFVDNTQAQNIGDLSVALGKGASPPPGTDLVDLPFVELQNVESRTQTTQIRADLWVLPFLNVFGAIGDVTGDVDLDVVVDLDQTGLCPTPATCGIVDAGFTAGVRTNTVTLGATGVYGWENWFVSGTASGTASFGENTDYAVTSFTASGRFGRRWAYGPGHIVSPYLGVSYFYLDQVVEGTTRLPDAFPDGDSLDVRYKAQVENDDRWSGVAGVNLGFISGYSITAEVNFSDNNARTVIGASYRF